MSDRAYTVKEIDDLRGACEMRWLFGTTKIIRNILRGCSYNQRDKDHGIEELVRTYMLAGLVAKDLYEADNPKKEEGKNE